MALKLSTKNIAALKLGDRDVVKVYLGDKIVFDLITEEDPFSVFIDPSGSPGPSYPINDLNGNIMANLEKGIAYYGTVSHSELFTADELTSEIGLTSGNSSSNAAIGNEEVWHKYYWNNGIHFWRKPVRSNVRWSDVNGVGAVYGTGTITSRKRELENVFPNHISERVHDAEVSKNGVTYAVRMMESAIVDPAPQISDLHGSEHNLILLNLHVATNSGEYSDSPTDGLTYTNWAQTTAFTNNDFVGWVTNLDDTFFRAPNNATLRFLRQEWVASNNILWRSSSNLAIRNTSAWNRTNFSQESFDPVLTVKHPNFTYE